MDAECTHDGSIKHIQKFESWGWTSLQRRVLDAERTDSLTVLQVLIKLIRLFVKIVVNLDKKIYFLHVCV